MGEAVTSMLEAKGAPGMAERTLIRPPSSTLGPVDPAIRREAIATSPIAGKYEAKIDRESAHEILAKRAEEAAKAAAEAERREEEGDERAREFNAGRRYAPGGDEGRSGSSRSRSSKGGSFGDEVAKVVIKELKGTTGRRIVRGIFGTIFKAK